MGFIIHFYFFGVDIDLYSNVRWYIYIIQIAINVIQESIGNKRINWHYI